MDRLTSGRPLAYQLIDCMVPCFIDHTADNANRMRIYPNICSCTWKLLDACASAVVVISLWITLQRRKHTSLLITCDIHFSNDIQV